MERQDKHRPSIVICGRPRNVLNYLLSSLSWSSLLYKFQMRYPRLDRSFLELRSVAHRIGLLWTEAPKDLPQMGRAWYQDADHSLRVNTKTQGRTASTQNLLARQPWASPEDVRLFLSGWEQGCEWACGSHDIREPMLCESYFEQLRKSPNVVG